MILGSGFGSVAAAIQVETLVSFGDLPGLANPTVPGHAGEFLLGTFGGAPVIAVSGRLHPYEGHDAATVVFPVRVLAALGVRALLLTNAAGGIRQDLEPGDLVALTDHVNFAGFNPLRGCPGPHRFLDLTEAYSPALRHLLHHAAADAGIVLKEGIYGAMSGPSYETPAEIRCLATLGVDLVGMSTVAEVIAARHAGLEVAAVSCVTNRAAGLGGRISHDEVLAVGRQSSPTAVDFLKCFARRASDRAS